MTLLSVQHASLGYHSRHPVLRDVSFSVAPGSICCLIGANGSGKTTLMRTILGVLQPLAGQITLDGIAVNHLSDRERAPPSPGFLRHMTVRLPSRLWTW